MTLRRDCGPSLGRGRSLDAGLQGAQGLRVSTRHASDPARPGGDKVTRAEEFDEQRRIRKVRSSKLDLRIIGGAPECRSRSRREVGCEVGIPVGITTAPQGSPESRIAMLRTTTPTPATTPGLATTNIRTGLDTDAIAQALVENLHCLQGRPPELASRNDWYMALAYTVRDRMMERYIATLESIANERRESKAVAYLSAEFLMGPHLGNGLINLGIWEAAERAVSSFGQTLSDLLEQEEEPGLGNGGLGRLAACYMDSLSTLNVPAVGYGLRYEFGIFDQVIRNGWQVEITDKWLRYGNPWEIVRSEITCDVKLGGRTESYRDEEGRYRVRWLPERVVRGIAYDTPVPGYREASTNILRLWKAEATESFDFDAFNV